MRRKAELRHSAAHEVFSCELKRSESEGGNRLQHSSRVFRGCLDEDVEIIREARLCVEGNGEGANDQRFDMVIDDLSEEVCEITTRTLDAASHRAPFAPQIGDQRYTLVRREARPVVTVG